VARQLDAWDGAGVTGQALVGAIVGLEELRGRAPEVESVRSFRRALAKLTSLARGSEPDFGKKALESWDLPEKTQRLLSLVPHAPFPWDDPADLIGSLHKLDNETSWRCGTLIADLAALVLSEPASPHAASARAWLRTALTLHERDHWLPAAIALSRHLATLPEGHPELAVVTRGAPPGEDKAAKAVKTRHSATLKFLLVLRRCEGDPGRAATLLTHIDDVPTDVHTRTAMVHTALEVSTEDGLRETALALAEQGLRLIARTPGAQLSYQAWELFRRFAEIRAGDVDAFVPETLLGPADLLKPSDADIAEALYDGCVTLSWLRSARALPEELREDWRERLLGGRLAAASDQLRGLTDPKASWSACLRGALSALHPEVWPGLPLFERCGHLVAAFGLLAREDVQGLRWSAVAATAGADWACHSTGTVREAARSDLIALAAQRDALFPRVLHEREATAGDAGQPGIGRLLGQRWRRDDEAKRWRSRDLTTRRGEPHRAEAPPEQGPERAVEGRPRSPRRGRARMAGR
jgi:hypothetical protein